METKKKWSSESEFQKTSRQRRKRNDKHHPSSSSSSSSYSSSRRTFQHYVEKTTTCNNTHLSSSSSSSSVSIDAPGGCLRFFLPQSSSSSTAAATSTTKTPFNRSHFISKTPKSAPISRLPRSKPFPFFNQSKPVSHKPDKVKNTQSSKKPTSETPSSFDSNKSLASAHVLHSLSVSLDSNNPPPLTESLSVSQDPLDLPEKKELHFATPVTASKIASSSPLDCLVTPSRNRIIGDDDGKSNPSSSNTKTPPIQASFSPEIQSTTVTATTPACYAAGHLISGVTDRRKCRARGVLAIPESTDNDLSTQKSNSYFFHLDEAYATELINKSSVFMLPSPAEASMHWLLSPSREDDEDDKENSTPSNRLSQHTAIPSPSSPLSDLGFSFNQCNLSSSNTSDATNNSSSRKSQRNKNNMLVSTQLPQFQVRLDSSCEHALLSSSPNATPHSRSGIPLKEDAKHSCNVDGGNSPFSMSTFGSENVMQTPNSDSSLESHVGLSYSSAKDHKRHHFHSELLSVAADLQKASLSPKSHESIWDTTSSSFQFDGQITSPSNSIDLFPIQKVLNDQSLRTSNSTFENVSLSQMRISWREGLVSPIFEMDEFDNCRCLSDEEEDLNVNSCGPLTSCQSLESNVDVGNVITSTDACGSTKFLDGESKGKLQSPLQCSYAESISTDGGGLARSDDSEWNLCYKYNLFELIP